MPRYQAAILRDDEILLIQHREHTGRAYWLFPGGGREEGESEEDCVRREMREETGLEVEVQGLLLDDQIRDPFDGSPRHFKTYLCRILSGEAAPGYEPEPEASAFYSIVAVGWFKLHDESSWGELILKDPLTYPTLQKVRAALDSR
jgi:ADP-ribose pyrophosphatase YjhB (NUDIX family)